MDVHEPRLQPGGSGESNDVVDAIQSFLRHNGVDLAGPATIRLVHGDDGQWTFKPRMVLEADLRYEGAQLDAFGEPESFDAFTQLDTGNCHDEMMQYGGVLSPHFNYLGGHLRNSESFNIAADTNPSTTQQLNNVLSPWLPNSNEMETEELAHSSSPLPNLTTPRDGEEVDMMGVFPSSRAVRGQTAHGRTNRSWSISRGTPSHYEAADQMYDAQSSTMVSFSRRPSFATASITDVSILPNTPSPESIFLGSHSSATTASTPATSVTRPSPRSQRSFSISSQGRKVSRKARQIAISASRNVIRDDYLQYMKTEVASWISNNKWLVNADVQQEQAPLETSAYTDLEIAYSTVCKLDTRISIDVIRSRVALIRLHHEYVRTCESWDASGANSSATDIGRGKASFIIDHILGRIHQDWSTLDKGARQTLRNKFHSQKRFGKRWLLMMEALGPGILLICSHKLANMIRNSAVTIQMLEGIAHRVNRSGCREAQVLQIVKPVANSMFTNSAVDANELERMIQELESMENEDEYDSI